MQVDFKIHPLPGFVGRTQEKSKCQLIGCEAAAVYEVEFMHPFHGVVFFRILLCGADGQWLLGRESGGV